MSLRALRYKGHLFPRNAHCTFTRHSDLVRLESGKHLVFTKKGIPPNTTATYPSAKTALLLLDYDNIIVDMIHPVEEKNRVVNTANALLKTARESSATVVHGVINMNA